MDRWLLKNQVKADTPTGLQLEPRLRESVVVICVTEPPDLCLGDALDSGSHGSSSAGRGVSIMCDAAGELFSYSPAGVSVGICRGI